MGREDIGKQERKEGRNGKGKGEKREMVQRKIRGREGWEKKKGKGGNGKRKRNLAKRKGVGRGSKGKITCFAMPKTWEP